MKFFIRIILFWFSYGQFVEEEDPPENGSLSRGKLLIKIWSPIAIKYP